MTIKEKRKSVIRGLCYIGIIVAVIIPVGLYTFFDLDTSRSSYTEALKQQKETNRALAENQKIFNGLNSDEALILYARSHYIFVKDNEKVINIPLDD